ncbi:U-box domain-containing protein 35-like [Cynara cardunculus var. scolymus]|uniref:U-box domain-containing protein 35-like n=1 Tax=Cynara cardunculus var. scolymus TaxID=59895 RepID=UPI000D626CAA|nr:U-box domain-containing protein 35-like [Cynara cardunculus var. scolymus]
MAEKDVGYLGSDEWAPPPINIINFDNYRINNAWSNHEIVEEDDDDDDDDNGRFGGSRLMPSITEEYDDGDAGNLFSYDSRNGSDVVYVVTWRGTEELSSASMDALVWTLGNDLHESTIVYLVHVFPELRYIPTPLGRLPISQANPEQKESCLVQERSKRSEYLQRFLSLCSSSKVQVETVLIESDMEAKAILDLIPILNIRTLVLGATKSNLRKLRGSSKKGGGGTLDQILHNAPESCDVKVICEGKEVSLQDQSVTGSPTPSVTAQSPRDAYVNGLKTMPDNTDSSVKCSCFKL